jgi:beta-N-acetylhexosaminidase
MKRTAIGKARGTRRIRQPHSLLALFALLLALLAACASPQADPSVHRPASSSTTKPSPTAGAAAHTHSAGTPGPVAPQYDAAILQHILDGMTLDQKLGQLFVVEYLYTDADHPDLDNMIDQMGAGGVILYQSMNIESIAQMRQLTSDMQARARIPLILGADQEGGGDDQIDTIFGPHPAAWDIGQTGDPAVAAQNAARMAGELKQLGMNADFAPVVDVLTPQTAWIRAFSRSPDMVAKMGIAQVDAYQQNGVMACPKHFPGLGATVVNPHDALPVINSSRAFIEQHDLAPYRALIAHDPAMIMTTDLLMPALDPAMPAELSYPIVTGVLRKELGYDGVVITDALYMGGVTDRYSMAQAGVLAILAGNDMLEGPWDTGQMRAMVDALRAAVQSGRLSEARVNQSVMRILRLKQRFGLLPHVPLPQRQPVSGDNVPGAMLPGGASALVPDPRHTGQA